LADELTAVLGGLIGYAAVLAALGVGALRLLGEVQPGVPLGLAEGSRSMPVIAKAGASGPADALVRCRERLRATGLPPVPEAGTGKAAPHIL